MGHPARAAAALLLTVAACGLPDRGSPQLAAGPQPAATATPSPDPLTIELPGEPAPEYRADRDLDASSPLARRIRSRLPMLHVDPCLEQAAAAHLTVPAELAARLPLDFTEFALHWAGCPDATATLSSLQTSDDGDEVVLEELARLCDGGRYSHAGVARTGAAPPYRTRWLALLVDRRFSLRPVPALGQPGARLPVQFTVDPEFARVTVAVSFPSGEVATFDAGLSDGQGVASVPLGDRVGRQWVELIGHGRSGPHVLALFPIAIGRLAPRIWIGRTRADESWIDTVTEAEAFAADLLRQDRSRFDLPELLRDSRLDAVARQHSQEMATAGYFAHISPTTGSIADRLRAVGYPAAFAAENIALGSELGEAQEKLMRSPGHRAAILARETTRFGVGVAFREDENGVARLLTQIFVARIEDRPGSGGPPPADPGAPRE